MMRYFYFIFHLDINSVRKVIIVCIFTGKGKDSEKLNNYLKVTYLLSGRNQIQTEMCQDAPGVKLEVSKRQTEPRRSGAGACAFSVDGLLRRLPLRLPSLSDQDRELQNPPPSPTLLFKTTILSG